MNNIKKLTIPEIQHIQDLYSNYKLPYFPQILNINKSQAESSITFEWIDGKVADETDMSNAFYSLGKQHILNKNSNFKFGFETIIHGDFHRNNIIITETDIKFIDITFAKREWNYADFDYVDFYNIFDPTIYPWMIKNTDCLSAYHNAIKLKVNPTIEEQIKEIITIKMLYFNIKNGKKNNIDTSFEEKALNSFNNKGNLHYV